MRSVIKLLISIVVIVFCTQTARRWPSFAGLTAVMPLTGLVVLLWLYSDNPGNFELMSEYTLGALLGIVPSILFFLAAFLCFRRGLGIRMVLAASFAVWLIAAFIHQWLLNR